MAANGQEAEILAGLHSPDVAVMDVSMIRGLFPMGRVGDANRTAVTFPVFGIANNANIVIVALGAVIKRIL